MKRSVPVFSAITVLVLSGCIQSLNAQVTVRRSMINPTSVSLLDGSSKDIKGALYQLKDTSILLSHSVAFWDYKYGEYSTTELRIADIQGLKIKSKKRITHAELIGAAAGFVVGWIAWNQGTDEGEPFFSGIFGGIIGAPFGMLAGYVVGASIKIKIPINGQLDNYNAQKETLRGYSIKD
jgi:hypothetical protein